jgi:2-amino-1-hydroxyethylphosphonate dioxygenase (glycine-forming)
VERPPNAAEVWDRIESRFARLGGESYGEGVTQLEHALQSAQLARRAGAPDDEVLAALLHDLGHLVDDAPPMDELGAEHHEDLGAALLSELGFAPAVTELVAAHVRAKRYLVFRDARYRARLSEASHRSLVRQGGPFTEEEARAFESAPHFAAALRLRSWDDRAKEPGLAVTGLASYRALVMDHVTRG